MNEVFRGKFSLVMTDEIVGGKMKIIVDAMGGDNALWRLSRRL